MTKSKHGAVGNLSHIGWQNTAFAVWILSYHPGRLVCQSGWLLSKAPGVKRGIYTWKMFWPDEPVASYEHNFQGSGFGSAVSRLGIDACSGERSLPNESAVRGSPHIAQHLLSQNSRSIGTDSMQRNGRLTHADKLKFLSGEWGYAEVTTAVLALSGDRRFLVKNYRGKLPSGWNVGDPLPGNPCATVAIETTAYSEQRAIHAAYWKAKRGKRESAEKDRNRNGT